eukprot:gene32434-42022_t
MNIIICCFKSCLKGENDREYYNVLELDPRCDHDSIRKQYRKLSLVNHPDRSSQRGAEATAGQIDKFLRVKEAYDVLSDRKRRKLYDELGASGLKFFENPTDFKFLIQNFQRNRKDRCKMLSFILFAFLSLLVLPVFFSLKCDGTLGPSFKWVEIWIPMWIVDLLLLGVAFYVVMAKDLPSEGGEIPPPKIVTWCNKLLTVVSASLFVLLQVLTMIRLDGYVNWSWFVVFAPWFLLQVMVVLVTFSAAFLNTVPLPDRREYSNLGRVEIGESDELVEKYFQSEVHYNQKILVQSAGKRKVVVALLRIWFAAFLAAKIDQSVSWNWGLVFLPVWLYLLINFVYAVYYKTWSYRLKDELNIEAIALGTERDPIQLANAVQAEQLSSMSSSINRRNPLLIALLLVCRLQLGTAISTFIIILPIFIIIGCSCIVFFCGFCFFSVMDVEDLESGPTYEEIRSSVNRRQGVEGRRQGSGIQPPTSYSLTLE